MITRPIPKRAKVGPCSVLAVLVAGAILLPMARAGRTNPSPSATSTPKGSAATLPDGVTVELVGLGTAPWKTEQQWWLPDGTRIDKPAFKTVQNQPLLEWPDTPQDLLFRSAILMKLSGHLGKDVSVPRIRFSNDLLCIGMRDGIGDDGTQLMYLVSHPLAATTQGLLDLDLQPHALRREASDLSRKVPSAADHSLSGVD